MGLFSDNIQPIKNLVSLSGRGGNSSSASSSNNNSCISSSSNSTSNSSNIGNSNNIRTVSGPIVAHNDKTGGGSSNTHITDSTSTNVSDNQKSLTASTSHHNGSISKTSSILSSLGVISVAGAGGGGSGAGGGKGSGNMQQLSTSWEFIKLESRPIHDLKTDDEKDELQDVAPPRFIKISDGEICLGPPKQCENTRDKEVLEARIIELEEALLRLQEKVNNSQCGSPTLDRDLKEQLESMNRAMKSKERKAMQACRDHKVLQARFSRQETLLHIMQQENRTLHQRIRQYEHCLDDVMRKVVDAIVAEDSLREEVTMLKSRVRDLEAQNAALTASPAKGKDEGYCTMSSGQPQPSNSHLEDLPEEPEQWLISAEPCSAEMEDWSMSQEELGIIALDDESNEHEHDWIWNSSGYLNSTMIDTQSDGISRLLQETIVYSEDEELACIDFTKDFYKLVNIPSGSTRSLYSHMEAETDDEDDTPSEFGRRNSINSRMSPTPSEAGQAQVTSCSSSESDEQAKILGGNSNIIIPKSIINEETTTTTTTAAAAATITTINNSSTTTTTIKTILRNESKPINSEIFDVNSSWKRSNGWKRIASSQQQTPIKDTRPNLHKQLPTRSRESKIPPPVPVRRSYAS